MSAQQFLPNVTDDKPLTNTKRFAEPIWLETPFSAKEHFIVPLHYNDYVDNVFIPHGLIIDRIEKLAHDIAEAFRGEELHIICILKGSRGFFTALLHYLNKIYTYQQSSLSILPYMEHYVRIKTYVDESSEADKKFQVVSDDLSCLEGKCVLIVEDIIDTGNTLTKFCSWLNNLKPKQVCVAALLEKRTNLSNGFQGNFVGFSVPDEFLVGFSLDYNERFRDLEHVCVLNEKGRTKFKSS